MKKTHKVVMLPTEKASNIQLISNKFLHLIKNFGVGLSEEDKLKGSTNTPQHLYILSDDEIKEGDWHYNPDNNSIIRAKMSLGIKAHKVIATTDKSLTINGYDSSDEEAIVKLYLPQLPESFIQAYIKAYNEGKPITEVDLEMHNIWGTVTKDDWRIKTRPDNTVIVHQSKMYTRDEVTHLLEQAFLKGFQRGSSEDFDKWIQDNL